MNAPTLQVVMFLAGIVIPVAFARAEVLIFDMGTDKSADWPGSKKVTPKDAGWQSTKDLKGHMGRGDGNTVWTNPMTEDAVFGEAANAFRFQAPAGKWSVYVLCGACKPAQGAYLDFDVSVGNETWTCRIPPGVQYCFEHHTFTATSDGQIEVKFTPRNKWCVAGIVAWQAADADQAKELIRKIEQWAPDEEIAKWKPDPAPPTGPEPKIGDGDRKRGFCLWSRHWAQVVYPKTNPTQEEMDPTLRIFASPGEYEPMTFIIRPLKDLARAEVRVEAIGPVPAENIEVRKVRYLPARPNYTVQYRYRIVPDILDRWTSTSSVEPQTGPLPAGENARFWLTVRVPDKTAPGLYKGRVQFIADGQAADVPVQLRILDIRLEEDPNHTYAIYYRHPLGRAASAPDEHTRKYWLRKAELEHADMAAHGTRNVTLSCGFQPADDTGRFDANAALELLDQQLKLAERFKFQPPYVMSINTGGVYRKYMKQSFSSHLAGVKMPPEAFFKELTAMTKLVEDERKRRAWPAFVYYPVDEPGHDEASVQFMAGVLKAVRAAGVRTYLTADPTSAAFAPLKPFVDVWCTQPFLPDRETILADMKARGVEYWCYPNHVAGENDHTTVAGARMTYGFGFWRSGFLRLIPWIYQAEMADPFNYLDGTAMDFMNRSEPDGTPLPVTIWEAYREGYDDYRYVFSLQQAIARAEKSASDAARQEAAEAQKVLEELWKAIPVLAKYKYDGFWPPEEMDVRRWQIAERLEKLSQVLR